MNHTTNPQDAVCDTCEHNAHQPGQCQGASISRITGCRCQAEQPATLPSAVVPADRATLLRAADFFHGLHTTGTTITAQEAEAELRRMAAEAAVTPPPALTEAGRLRAQVEVLQRDAARDQGLAKVGARCMRDGHQGLIEGGRIVLEGWRFALSTALGLGTGGPWEAIHERVKELRRVAAEEQPAETQDGATADKAAVLLEIAATLDGLAETDMIRKRRSLGTARRLLAGELRRMAAEPSGERPVVGEQPDTQTREA